MSVKARSHGKAFADTGDPLDSGGVVARLPDALVSEDGVRLAASLRGSLGDGDRVVMFVGLGREAGSTFVASQVALALSDLTSQPVVLADLDLEKGMLHELFGARRSPGLREVLRETIVIEDALHELSPGGVSILPAGETSPTPAFVERLSALEVVVNGLRRRFRYVILDIPDIFAAVGVAVVSPVVDGAVLVARAGHRRKSELVESKGTLENLKVRSFGVVLSETRDGGFGVRRGM